MDFLVKHYEKIILGIFLMGMLGWCWFMLQTMTTAHQHIFDLRQQMETAPTVRKPLPSLKPEDFTGLQALADPRAEWIMKGDPNIGTMIDPPRYIRCKNSDCVYLLTYNTQVCPFCKTDQGPIIKIEGPTGTLDSDGDGIPDVFEKKYTFLDSNDANDANRDEDNDKFTNLEEFNAGTRPDDPNGHPPMAAKLRFIRTLQSPLPIMFDKLTRNPKIESDKWIMQFTLTEGNRRVSRFVRVGEKIGEYSIVSLTPKSVNELDPKVKMTFNIDVSEVVIKRGNEEPLTLIRGKTAFEKGFRTELLFLSDVFNARNCLRFDLRVNDQFQLPAGAGKKETYLLKEVVGEEAIVVLVGSNPPQEFKVMKLSRTDFRRSRTTTPGRDTPGAVPGAPMMPGMPGAPMMPGMPPPMPQGIR